MILAVLVGITQIWFFVFTVLDSKPGENRYGSNPKGITEAPPRKKEKRKEEKLPDVVSPAERVRRLAREDASSGEPE